MSDDSLLSIRARPRDARLSRLGGWSALGRGVPGNGEGSRVERKSRLARRAQTELRRQLLFQASHSEFATYSGLDGYIAVYSIYNISKSVIKLFIYIAVEI